MQVESVSPFLRWAGSKRKLLPRLRPLWSERFSRYVEPFMGSAVLYFSIRPRAAILSDLNAELTEAFLAVRASPRKVYSLLSNLPQCEDGYYAVRAIAPCELEPLERAARFIYLNRFCFNGLYRTNVQGQFNVPYASKKTPLLPTLATFTAAARALTSATILTGDFESILRANVQPGDLVYLDPPYAVANRRIFRQYGPQTFGAADLRRLQALLPWIKAQGASFVLSYARSPESATFFAGWPVRRVVTQRNIGGFADRRRKAVEMFIVSHEDMIAA